MDTSRSYRRIQDEAGVTAQSVVDAVTESTDEGLCECGIPLSECEDAQFDIGSSPIFSALFGAIPSQADLEQMKRDRDRDGLLAIVDLVAGASADMAETHRMVMQIVQDELSGL